MDTFLVVLTAYLIGAIPFALITGKWFHKVDIRQHGSGNLGTTNTFRVLGKKAGIIVLIGDVTKGTLATSLPLFIDTSINPLWLGVIAVIGHCYPVYANFKGGKAVATSAGVLLAIEPLLFCTALLVFVLALVIFRMVSFSSLVSSFYASVYAICFADNEVILAVTGLMIFIIYRHRSNIGRIFRGEEPKLTIFPKKK